MLLVIILWVACRYCISSWLQLRKECARERTLCRVPHVETTMKMRESPSKSSTKWIHLPTIPEKPPPPNNVKPTMSSRHATNYRETPSSRNKCPRLLQRLCCRCKTSNTGKQGSSTILPASKTTHSKQLEGEGNKKRAVIV